MDKNKTTEGVSKVKWAYSFNGESYSERAAKGRGCSYRTKIKAFKLTLRGKEWESVTTKDT